MSSNTIQLFVYHALIRDRSNINIDAIEVALISGDASFRRYYRAQYLDESYIVMQSPVDAIDNQIFIDLTQHYAAHQLPVADIIAIDKAQGFLLLSDLGSVHLEQVWQAQQQLDVYQQIINILPNIASLPLHQQMKPYNQDFMESELDLFTTWCVDSFCQLETGTAFDKMWRELKQTLINTMLIQPQVTMHRDFHCRNIMYTCHQWALIDYQDSVQGPICYDLVSLLRDSYQVFTHEQHRQLLNYGFQVLCQIPACQQVSKADFELFYYLTGMQRQLKILGIFCRLAIRDGKPDYLNYLNTTLVYIIESCTLYQEQFPVFGYFKDWLETVLQPAIEVKL